LFASLLNKLFSFAGRWSCKHGQHSILIKMDTVSCLDQFLAKVMDTTPKAQAMNRKTEKAKDELGAN
jgi:hypothetical protein